MPKRKLKPAAPQVQNQSAVPIVREFKREAENMVQNGLGEALLGFNPGCFGAQLSQLDTLFKNNRWYLISNMRQLCSEVYVEHGLIQTVIDVPVDDGLRGGIEINSKQLSPEQIEELALFVDREDIMNSSVGQALKWNRLYGGAGILIMTDQDPITPLDVNAIGFDSPLGFRAVDMWELFWDQQNMEGYDPTTQQQDFEFYSYYGQKVHKSRVLRMKGLTAPSFIRPRLRGWGFSILESVVRSVNQYLKEQDLTFEVLDEFKIDVYKLKGLAQTLLNPDGTAQVQRRVSIANQQKSFQSAITLDSEDDYDHKQLSFAGLAEIMKEIRMQVASDLRMPLTKVFGISAQGFNSGEDDIENYNGMVESQVRSKSKYDILRILEISCQKLFGMVPDDLEINFKPLRVLSSEQEEIVKTAIHARLLATLEAGAMTAKEFKDSCNKADIFPVKLDTSIDMLDDQMGSGDLEDDAAESKVDEGSPGANKPNTAKPQLKGEITKKPKTQAKEAKDAPT